jgi:gas vesicle protein
MKTTITGFCLSAALFFTPVFAQSVKQDMKTAGSDTKNAAKETGKATKHAAVTAKHKTQHTVHKASSKVADKTAGH